MGKGRSSGRFYKFIDESYFGYQFWIWGLILSLLGIGMIVAGIVVYETMPAAREAEIIASAKLASGDTESMTYTSWSSIAHTVSYTFKNINATGATPTCNKVGPYVYVFTTTKASLVFSADGTKVTYTIQATKAFSTTASVPAQNVRQVDPNYANLIIEAGGEGQFFWDLFIDHGNYSELLNDFVQKDMPALLGSRAFSRSFRNGYKAARRGVLDNAVFGDALDSAVSFYPTVYANALLARYRPTAMDVQATDIGFANMLFWFSRDSACHVDGMTPSKGVFYGHMVNGWTGVSSSACTDFFRERSFDPAAGFTAGEAEEAIEDVPLSFWNNEHGTGVCQVPAADIVISTLPLSAAKVTHFCTVFLPKWIADTVPAGDTFEDLGKKKLCVGTIDNISSTFNATAPAFIIHSLPALVRGQMPAVNINRPTYSATECGKIIDALKELDEFVAPVIEGEDVTMDHQLSAADLALAKAFVNTHASSTQKWLFTYHLISTEASNPIDSCTDCVFKSLTHYGLDVTGLDTTFSAFINNFFPEMTPANDPQKTLRDRHACTQVDPKPDLGTANAGNIFGTWQFTTPGALSFLRDTIPSNALASLGLSATTAQSLKSYITKVAEDILQGEYGLSTLQNIAYQQFATGGAMFGTDCSTPSRDCSVAHQFYAFNEDYYVEYGLARALGPFTFTESFGTAGSVDPPLAYTDVQVMLDVLFSSEYDDLTHIAGRKYFHYFAPTFIRSRFFRASDGILPLRSAPVWVDSAEDNNLLVARFGGPNVAFHVTSPFPTPVERNYTIYTGTDKDIKSFTYSAVEGLSQAVGANGNVAIDGLYNTDQFPPGAVKKGDNIKIFNPVLERALSATVGEEEMVESLSGNAIVMEKLPWSLRTTVPGAILVPCGTISGAPAELVCADEAADNVDSKVIVSVNSGKVLHEQHCYQSVVAPGNVTFPITEPNLSADALYSQVQIKYGRTMSAADADAFAAQFNEAEQLASNIRAALCAVGAFFLAVGLVFAVFAIIRHVRKLKKQAETELVEDPFKENQRTGFTR